jgi:hypothetical protein
MEQQSDHIYYSSLAGVHTLNIINKIDITINPHCEHLNAFSMYNVINNIVISLSKIVVDIIQISVFTHSEYVDSLRRRGNRIEGTKYRKQR